MLSDQQKLEFGFLKQAFKFQPRASQSCLHSGKEMLYSSVLLLEKYLNFPYDKDISFNFNDTLIKFLTLCNFWDTVQGIILLNWIVNVVDLLLPSDGDSKVGLSVKVVLRVFEATTIINDLVDFSAIFQSFFIHFDKFSLGQFLGKLSKLLVEAWLSGLLQMVFE